MGPRPCLSHTRATASAAITILLLIPAATSQASILKTEAHVFGPFNSSYYDILDVIPMGTISNGALQLSPDSAGNASFTNNAGAVFFKNPFRLWEDEGKIASFNTSFLFNIFRIDNRTPGEGLAFVVAPIPSNQPYSYGQYLGLTNAASDGQPTNQIVAIELDTMKQEFDPDDNHIGLDINSVRSNKTVSLSQYGFQIAPNGTQFYVLWVDYDGDRKMIDVYMAPMDDMDAPIVAKPSKPVLTSSLDLKAVVNQRSYFGFSSSTGDTYELNSILRWNLSVEVLSKSTITEGKNEKPMKMGLGIGVPLLFVFVTVSVYLLFRKIISYCASDPQLLRTLKKLPGTPREFSFQELKKATNNFDDRLKLGQGGFGVVYRGSLPKEELEVAVKKFSRDQMRSTDDFLAELTIINRLRHKHLVRLLGWCHKSGVLLLVYDYMPNGSLDKHIFCEGTRTAILSWDQRHKIIIGVASALHYLHNECDQKVIHRDLKASNIMLDSNFDARLGDFGLARALENEKTSYAELEGVAGTRGYIAPEYLLMGKATRESDVYGFGAVLLEVVCGRRPWTRIEGCQFLVDWVWQLYREGRILEAVDNRLGNNYMVEEAERILKLGLACSNPIAIERPKMQTIVQIISASVPVPHVPPIKPTFVWPAVDIGSITCDSTSIATIDSTPINSVFFAR